MVHMLNHLIMLQHNLMEYKQVLMDILNILDIKENQAEG